MCCESGGFLFKRFISGAESCPTGEDATDQDPAKGSVDQHTTDGFFHLNDGGFGVTPLGMFGENIFPAGTKKSERKGRDQDPSSILPSNYGVVPGGIVLATVKGIDRL